MLTIILIILIVLLLSGRRFPNAGTIIDILLVVLVVALILSLLPFAHV